MSKQTQDFSSLKIEQKKPSNPTPQKTVQEPSAIPTPVKESSLDELKEQALAQLNAVESEAMEKLGKDGCNPYLYKREVLLPLRNLIALGDQTAIATAIQAKCPALPNGGTQGPMIVG